MAELYLHQFVSITITILLVFLTTLNWELLQGGKQYIFLQIQEHFKEIV